MILSGFWLTYSQSFIQKMYLFLKILHSMFRFFIYFLELLVFYSILVIHLKRRFQILLLAVTVFTFALAFNRFLSRYTILLLKLLSFESFFHWEVCFCSFLLLSKKLLVYSFIFTVIGVNCVVIKLNFLFYKLIMRRLMDFAILRVFFSGYCLFLRRSSRS